MQAVALEIRIVRPDGSSFHAMGSDTMTYRDGRWSAETFNRQCVGKARFITKHDRANGYRAFLTGYTVLEGNCTYTLIPIEL